MNEDRIIDVIGVSKRFGGLMAVNDVTLHLNKGEILGLIGANGAGKTTLFNMISGTLPATSGKILFDGVEIQRMKPYRICKMGMGRTYQIVQPFTSLSLLENVMAGALLRHSSMKTSQEKAEAIIEKLNLGHLAHVPGRGLTLIQMKRMEIARALATEPQVLLLDEVMAGLNPTEREDLLVTIHEVKQTGVSIIIIEHVMKVIMNLSNRIYVLNQGTVIAEGPPEEVIKNPEVIKSYIGENRYAS